MSFIVAIDGPAGSGKGTITEALSKKFNLINIGTGTAYRAIALHTINENINVEEKDKIIESLEKINIEFKQDNNRSLVFLNGKDVTKRVMDTDVAKTVSEVAKIDEVRFKLNDLFRKCAKGKEVIMEGRDIGTYVFPNADVKIFLDASIEERAKRRLNQNIQEKINLESTYEDILKNIQIRDKSDRERKIGAIKRAEDAVYIDSTNMTTEQVIEQASKAIEKKIS